MNIFEWSRYLYHFEKKEILQHLIFLKKLGKFRVI